MQDILSPTACARLAALTRFLQVAHHRHAPLARLVLTVPLLLLRALRVVLVLAHARLLQSQHHAVPGTFSLITHA
jgi:hypothetical protein